MQRVLDPPNAHTADQSVHAEHVGQFREVGGVGMEPAPARGHVGRIVAGTLIGGLLGAVVLVAGPLAGAREYVITGSVLLMFAAAWAMLAAASERWTDQPQRWAYVSATFMALAGGTILVLAPTGNQLGWVWPPAVATLAVWMIVRARRDLRSRTRAWLLYPVCGALLLSAVGGAYETYRETTDSYAMPGQLIDVGGHRLHINCTGTGSPTVVLEPGLGEPSTAMAWIAPDVAATTRVCVYDRAGRGWSESAGAPQDGVQVATDLHTLLDRAGEHGPYVLAGHSAGGLYVLNFARLFPDDVAGVALLDSMSPQQYTTVDGWPAFYEMYRRASAVMPSLARFGVGRLIYSNAYSDLPALARDQERAFNATPRAARSVRDEFSLIRTTMSQAQALTTLGDRPLVVLTAEKGALGGWNDAQDELAALSTNSIHRTLANADHTMITEDRATAAGAAQAIRDVVDAVRTSTPATTLASSTVKPVETAQDPTTTIAPATTVKPLEINQGPTTTIVPATTVARPTSVVDALVPVSGARLHVRCEGAGPTTVVLIAGFSGSIENWGSIRPTVAQTSRVCAYDRFGNGASDAAPAPQTFATQAADLHALLQAAGEPGPYVIVGHSFGGAEAVTFAAMFPTEVRGLLLLDASPPSWNTAICAVPDDGSDAAQVFQALCAQQSKPDNNVERLDAPTAFAQVAAIDSLNELHMIVATADHHSYSGLAASEEARLNDVWNAGQAHWVSLAASAQLITVDNTSHNIQLDRPDVVLDEIQALLQ